MPLSINTGTNYANQDTLAVAGTAQLLALGAETVTFAKAVDFLTIMYVSHDTYIAKTSAKVTAAAGGAADDRIFVKASTTGVTIPWGDASVYFLNVVTAETPAIYVVGHD